MTGLKSVKRDQKTKPGKTGISTQGSVLLLLMLLIALPLSALGQTLNPLESDPRAVRAGRALFRAQCATCHGPDARGIENIAAADLTTLWTLGDRTDEGVFQSIRNGVPGSIMPPHGFPDTEVWMLVSYLKSLDVSRSSTMPEGDSARGQALFTENCQTCHRVSGSGGSLGPDLSVITARRSAEALTDSIRNPSAILLNRYRPVTIITGSNQRVQGTLKSEDAFSIQVMDSEQNLRGFVKSDLRQLDYEDQSLMPVFGSAMLSDGDINDILVYLENQRRNATN